MRKRPGFTLIELLVVIVIIAILAAILFPVFVLARQSARKANCQSNLKQLTMANLQYMADWQDTFPALWVGYGGHWWWASPIYMHPPQSGTLMPYVKNNFQVFICRSSPQYTTPQNSPDPEMRGVRAATYMMNAILSDVGVNADGINPVPSKKPHKQSEVRNPSRTMLMVCGTPGCWAFPPSYWWMSSSNRWLARNHWTLGIDNGVHSGGYNVNMVDGSVRWCKVGTPQLDNMGPDNWWDLK